MYEHIFPILTTDEAIAFRIVKTTLLFLVPLIIFLLLLEFRL
jgi:hypothetical protein